MITLVDVKKGFIDKLKSSVSVTSLLSNSNEVREAEWQGVKFLYPNVRVFIEQFKRHTQTVPCSLFDVVAHIYVFADEASSLQTDLIAAEVWKLLDATNFVSNSIKFSGISAVHIGALWVDEGGTWRSEVLINCLAS
jgi:hypothetical protein